MVDSRATWIVSWRRFAITWAKKTFQFLETASSTSFGSFARRRWDHDTRIKLDFDQTKTLVNPNYFL